MMKDSRAVFCRILSAPIALAMVLGFAPSMRSQESQSFATLAPSTNAAAGKTGGIAGDWTHHHVIFSSPGAAEEAQRNGTYERWLKITNDPRYSRQLLKRNGAVPDLRAASAPTDRESELKPEPNGEDENLPIPFTRITEEDFPDGVLPRGLARAIIPPPSQRPDSQSRFSIAAIRKHQKKSANLIQKDWSETEGNNGTSGMGRFPATFTSNSASCSADFAVYNTGLQSSSSQASIVAFNQLYSGCSSRPSTYWAFNTGGTITTSVTISMDGTQVAFVQTDSTTSNADLVILKWAASSGTLTHPTGLTSNSSYPNCTAPCMISIALHGPTTDTLSSPFVDYTSGTIYVGDDAGKLHKFTNIFTSSTPGEVTSLWPVTLNTSTDAALGGPVYDSVSGNIFVGDYLANTSSNCQPGIISLEGQCGYLYSINASTEEVVRSAQLDYNLGIYDSPIVDPSAGMVYAFAGADNSTSCSSGPCAAVFQFPVGFVAGATGNEATVGAGYEALLSGTFDNQYFTSGSSPTGHLYVVGGTGPQNNTLYAIAINSNVMTTGSATAGPVVAANYSNGFYATGLQVTEFCNNGSVACSTSQGIDYLFLGVLSFGSQFTTNPCPSQSLSNGCIMGFTVPTSGTVASSATPNGVLPEAGGTSGIVVDNGAAGASNIYFSTLLNQACGTSGTGGCAVSATQAGLQ
jgi:hypothetical protein